MYYAIRHITEFVYSEPISESVMEVHMQPRTEETQRCFSFRLEIKPAAQVMSHRDPLGNLVHHFDIPQRHRQLVLTAESLVEMKPAPAPPQSLPPAAWDALDALVSDGDFWEALMPSRFAHPTPLLRELLGEFELERRDDPLSLMREINARMYDAFAYTPNSTDVHSPIDEALSNRAGVCQDYAHIMIALARELQIPCRYVSGYLYHRKEDHDRSEADASHAWLEALMPDLGWVGFDPTNNLIAGERHIRVAVGRDYADVPPTRGVYKGAASSVLRVGVRVYPTEHLPTDEAPLVLSEVAAANGDMTADELAAQQQQQQ